MRIANLVPDPGNAHRFGRCPFRDPDFVAGGKGRLNIGQSVGRDLKAAQQGRRVCGREGRDGNPLGVGIEEHLHGRQARALPVVEQLFLDGTFQVGADHADLGNVVEPLLGIRRGHGMLAEFDVDVALEVVAGARQTEVVEDRERRGEDADRRQANEGSVIGGLAQPVEVIAFRPVVQRQLMEILGRRVRRRRLEALPDLVEADAGGVDANHHFIPGDARVGQAAWALRSGDYHIQVVVRAHADGVALSDHGVVEFDLRFDLHQVHGNRVGPGGFETFQYRGIVRGGGDVGDAEALQLETRQGKRLGQCGCPQAAIECSREELQGHGVPQMIR